MYSVCFDLVSFSFECTILTPSVSVSDRERPEVQLNTIAPAKTKSHIIPVLIQFTEHVFLFNSSRVTISGGNLIRQAHKVQSTPLDMLTASLSFCCIFGGAGLLFTTCLCLYMYVNVLFCASFLCEQIEALLLSTSGQLFQILKFWGF